jgi:hypothetical protein
LANGSARTCSRTEIIRENFSRRFWEVNETVFSRLAARTVLDGRCEERKVRKVNATVKNNPVCTVSVCGWMERSAKPIKAEN